MLISGSVFNTPEKPFRNLKSLKNALDNMPSCLARPLKRQEIKTELLFLAPTSNFQLRPSAGKCFF